MMRASGASLFPLVLLALLAALTFWLERATQSDDPNRSGKERHDPDFFAERFTVHRYDADGRLQHTLVADKMLHYPDDDSTDAVSPRLTYHRARPTVVTSRTAWLDKDGKHVRLDDDVRIVRAGGERQPETVITTSVLYVTPDDEFAYTRAPVTITQGRSVVNGVGLEADNKIQTAVLFGRVHGTIYRNEQP